MESAAKKVITTIIVVLVFAAAAGAVYLKLSSAPSSSTPQPSSSSTQYSGFGNLTSTDGQNAQQGSANGQSQQDTSPVPDLNAAYDTVFARLIAQRVSWAPITASTTGSLAGIYALYAGDTAASKGAPMHAAAVDLNEDGIADAIVLEDLPFFCGSSGCPLDVYMKTKTGWQRTLQGFGTGEVGVANTLTRGHNDLFIAKETNAGPHTAIVRYTWDGQAYQPSRTAAVWNGSAFTLLP